MGDVDERLDSLFRAPLPHIRDAVLGHDVRGICSTCRDRGAERERETDVGCDAVLALPGGIGRDEAAGGLGRTDDLVEGRRDQIAA